MNDDKHTTWAFTPTTSLPKVLTIPNSHITLLDTFFHTVDLTSTSPSASQALATLFTPDGTWKTPIATFTGTQQLTESGTTWEFFKIAKSMIHWVDRVYVNDEEGRELMLLGRVRSQMDDGVVMEQQFGARVEIEGGGEAPRLRFFQGWSSRQ